MMIFPPMCNHEHAHIGLPLLKAYLVKQGYNSCTVRDYNVVIMNRLITEYMASGNWKHFGEREQDVAGNYKLAWNILKGESAADKLKTTYAADMIYRYLAVVGDHISELSFDPISLDNVEKEFIRTEAYSPDNPVYKYIEEEAVPEIIKLKPKVLGFSVTYASQVLYTLEICRKVRKICPDIKIFLGGAIASIFWKALMNRSTFAAYFDVIIREQGEVPLCALMDFWIQKSGTIDKIANLVYRNEDGGISCNPIGGNTKMDSIPMPDFSDLPLELYAYPKLPYQMTRGCYWGKCAFCGHRGCNNSYLVSDKDKVVSELEYLRDTYGIRMFHFVDDAILPRYFVDVAQRIIDTDLDIVYSAFLRTERGFTKENCETLFKGGLRSVLFGIESANKRILSMMEKGISTETMKEVLKNFKDAGISNHLSCIVGFPSEKREEAMETISFLLENKEIYHKAYLTPFGLFSDMVDNPDKFAISDVDIDNPLRHDMEGYVSFEYDYKRNDGMSVEEYLDVLKEGRRMIDSVPPGSNYFSKSL